MASAADHPSGNPAAPGRIFVTGGTGFLGRPLLAALLAQGRTVAALVRPGSLARLPAGCRPVLGDALIGDSYAAAVGPGDVFVHLVGVAHPSPRKALAFRAVDLASVSTAAKVARERGVARFVYVSVAQPAPIMQAYVEARAAGEAILRQTGLATTVVRPWYVLGPGRRWPLLLLPLYALCWLFPRARATARRLGLVSQRQMIAALQAAIAASTPGTVVLDVPAIRACSAAAPVPDHRGAGVTTA
jgi:uncharacterized protein YbjT (DUF2867 family)